MPTPPDQFQAIRERLAINAKLRGPYTTSSDILADDCWHLLDLVEQLQAAIAVKDYAIFRALDSCFCNGDNGELPNCDRCAILTAALSAPSALLERVRDECYEKAAQVCETLEFQDMTDADEKRYVAKFCAGHDIPMGFHADRLAAAIRQMKGTANG